MPVEGLHRINRDSHRVVYGDRQTVGIPGCNPNSLCFGCRVCKVPACLVNEGSQFFQVGICQIIHSFKPFHESNCSGAFVCPCSVPYRSI